MLKYIWVLLILLSVQSSLFADEVNTNDKNKIKRLESRMYHIEMSVKQNKSNVDKLKSTIQNHVLTLVLFAFFCAWWAKTSGRNTMLWFFLGLFFHVFTAIALIVRTEPKVE